MHKSFLHLSSRISRNLSFTPFSSPPVNAMTSASPYPWGSLLESYKPDMVIIAYTNSSALDPLNGTLFQDGEDNQSHPSSSSSPSSSSWWWSDHPSGYSWPHIISASILITLVILVIIIGNFLVIWAIIHDRNLKVTQNWFIASLACADLFIGLLVLPFSLTNELLGYWPFGVIFCEIYKATDVLLCTASIMSLCLISLDRYWSITRAVHYARQRTKKRAVIMIFTVWFISAVVCIPPLIGWNQPTEEKEWPLCKLSEDIGYVVYSASGSFFIPAFIMVFVYGKIYQAARDRARRAMVTNKYPAMETTHTRHNNSSESIEVEHRECHDNNANCEITRINPEEKDKTTFVGNTTEDTAGETVNETAVTSSEEEVKTHRQRQNGNDVILLSEEQELLNLPNAVDSDSNIDTGHQYTERQDLEPTRFTSNCTSDTDSVEPFNKSLFNTNDVETINGNSGNGSLKRFKIVELRANGTSKVANVEEANSAKRPVFAAIRSSLFPKRSDSRKNKQIRAVGEYSKCTEFQSADRQKKKLAKARERRATVVLGLVMAAFILCWLPFFVMYFISAFCSDCIPSTVFKVFFWIGYFNSALNPIIYTVFNREFRRAFQKILFGRKNNRR